MPAKNTRKKSTAASKKVEPEEALWDQKLNLAADVWEKKLNSLLQTVEDLQADVSKIKEKVQQQDTRLSKVERFAKCVRA